ncbi:MAG TPA: DNA repair protein RadC [Candidatus Paceibacterota bacterium]|jgi:DNA repair protein RadC|nr:DNA repair protein RadC [Candidatus Paceibacterota bacterium]
MATTYKIIESNFLVDDVLPKNISNKQYTFKFKDMPDEDKPREKLSQYGPSALSVQELVAIVLQTGTKKEDVMSMASRIIKDYGTRTLASQTDAQKLAKDLDVPIAKAMQIVACAELGRRFFDKRAAGPQTIRTAKDVFEYLQDMRNLPKEHLRGIYLNTHHKVIHDEVISIGTINSNLVHPREVFKPAIEHGAAGVILAHNHPSGIVTPSQADIEITKHIIEVGKIIGIPVIDHVVIGGNKFISIDVEY